MYFKTKVLPYISGLNINFITDPTNIHFYSISVWIIISKKLDILGWYAYLRQKKTAMTFINVNEPQLQTFYSFVMTI